MMFEFRLCHGQWTYCDGDCKKCQVIITDHTIVRSEK